MLAAVDFQNPLLWAILIGWILSVVLHEFAHGIVAYWGGDYTIRERGGLTLNPLQYVDPLMSIVLPVVFLLMGGVPLPGGATYIRRDLLRSKAWETAVSLAGPAMNLLLFLILCAFLLPRSGWIDPTLSVEQWTLAQKFVSAMAFLQLFAVLLNLVPVPPLDGFQAIAPYLPLDLRLKLSTPPWSQVLFYGYFLMVWRYRPFSEALYRAMEQIMQFVGVDFWGAYSAFQEAVNKSR
jgi:Zn-dependent protease